MKTNKNELDIDFLGGEASLTESEEKALSEYFRSRKITSKVPLRKLKSTTKSSRKIPTI